ncbi:MAG: nuclear transport factor 2 family protein [Methylococcales bacterium]|nr:nuclear transport factor 2 family protein [Methylococcales bacterium]
MNQAAQQLIENYYAAFNAGDMAAFLDLLTDDVVHDINQGKREVGKARFGQFMQSMNHHYREQLIDMAVMVNADGSRAAAEFIVLGEYLNTDEGLPVANGQRYRLPAGAFFEIRDGKVARITNYYNLEDWIAQVVTPV